MDGSIRSLLISCAVLLLAGCNSSPSPVASSPANTPTAGASPTQSATASPSPSATPQATDLAKSSLISAKGIGAAQLGMPLWKLKEILGSKAEFTVKSPFIVDFDAIAVSQGGEVQYYILYLANQSFTDDDVIQGLYTDNSKYRTSEGIGPGSELKTAELSYGKATLSYNTQNESREYARFERQPAANISFSTGNGNSDSAGIYSTTGEYNETQKFRDNATIKSILVVCLTEDCSAASPSATPSPGASPSPGATPSSGASPLPSSSPSPQ